MPLLAANVSDGDVVIEWQLAAHRKVVWERLTSTAAMTAWLGKPVVAEVRPGGSLAIDHGGGYICQSIVNEIVIASRFSLSWKFPDEHETEVSFGLASTEASGSGGCRLSVRHSNLAALTESYLIGWPVHLTYFEAVVHDDPIPTSQFWNLHATLQTLSDSGPNA